MARNRLFRTLSRVVDIKTGEGRIAALLFLYFFFITASYGIIKPLRNAFYLQENTAERLPMAYLLTAVFMGFVVALHSKYQAKLPRSKLIILTLIFFGVSSLVFAFLFRTDLPWVALVFFIWANAFIMVLSTQFFIVVNDVFNPREARRLIGFLISGGILGGILGNLFVGYFNVYIHDYLLFVAFGLILINIFIVGSIFIWKTKHRAEKTAVISPSRNQNKPSRKVGLKDCFNTVRKNSYLRLLAAVVTITMIVSTLIDWQYNTVVESSLYKPALYATWFGYANAGFLFVSFFFQLLMTSNIIKRFGIRSTLLIYPAMLFICAFLIGTLPTLFLIGPLSTLVLAVTIKGVDQSLDFSLNQSVRELLYIPVSPELKYKAKVFIDMFLNRFAKSFGALILMIVLLIPFAMPPDQEPNLIWKPRVLTVSIISLLFILAWILLNIKVSKEYAKTVKDKLAGRDDRADIIVGEKLDVDFMKLVVDTLENKERSSVLYAMDVFDLLKQDKLTPEVRKLIGYKQDELRASAIGSLIEESELGIGPQFEDTYDEEVLAKEIQEVMSLDVYQEVMSAHVQEVLNGTAKDDATEKMEAARVIGFMDSESSLTEKLDELLRDDSPDVSKYAMESAAKLKRREYIPALVEKLKNPMIRDDAKAALVKFGSRIIGTLSDYMGDRNENIELRRSVVEVLANIGNQEAVDFLLWGLTLNRNQIDQDIIDALDLIRSGKSNIQFEEKAVKRKFFERARVYYSELIVFSKEIARDEIKNIKLSDMPDRFSKLFSDLFKLLGLIYPYEDIAKTEQNIRAGTKEATAYAIEMLDNILKKDVKDVIFPLVENLTLSERIERCQILLASYPALKVTNVERLDS